MVRQIRFFAALVAGGLLAASLAAADKQGFTEGPVELQSAGALAFAPDGVLLVGDAAGAAVYAIQTGETSGNPGEVKINVDGIDKKIAAALGATADTIMINDLAVNPLSGNAYLSVSRGRGPDAAGVILKVDGKGEISELSLKKVAHAKAEIPNPPAPGGEGRQNQRAQSITDIGFYDGKVIVAGLSNEEFASQLRSIAYPFGDKAEAVSVEIYHGSHGKFETRSPVRTFTTYEIDSKPHVLAAYTCTPLVKFPLESLGGEEKVKGVTLAELGNHNTPLDMFIYQKDGKDFILMANDRRGLMKISTEDLARNEGITERVPDTAGQAYETIEGLTGVVQLDQLNDMSALVLTRSEDGAMSLKTVPLP